MGGGNEFELIEAGADVRQYPAPAETMERCRARFVGNQRATQGLLITLAAGELLVDRLERLSDLLGFGPVAGACDNCALEPCTSRAELVALLRVKRPRSRCSFSATISVASALPSTRF